LDPQAAQSTHDFQVDGLGRKREQQLGELCAVLEADRVATLHLVVQAEEVLADAIVVAQRNRLGKPAGRTDSGYVGKRKHSTLSGWIPRTSRRRA
jgi:hypothetical protein